MEKKLGSALWKEGFRYRKQYEKLIGKPDFVLVKAKVAIFCDSEFWHGYNWGEARKQEFKSNKDFWVNKIERNIERDRVVNKVLKTEGWKVLRFWSKDVKNNIDKCIKRVHLSIGM